MATVTGNWGRWGSEDERGTLNLITPDAVLAAGHGLTTGKVYSLALPISRHATPDLGVRPRPERLTLSTPGDAAMYEAFGAAPGVGANEDALFIPSHAGTHMDALCHVYSDGTVYNGHPASGFGAATGAARCGVEHNGSFAARAILLDVARHLGEEMLAPGRAITGDELEACRAAQGVDLSPGDALLIRTGWLEGRNAVGGTLGAGGEPGLGLDAVDFIRDHDVAVVAADNGAIECIPFDEGRFLGVHLELITKLGVTLVEHVWLADLAADGCWRSLLVVGALPVTGATGSPVNPIAIV